MKAGFKRECLTAGFRRGCLTDGFKRECLTDGFERECLTDAGVQLKVVLGVWAELSIFAKLF